MREPFTRLPPGLRTDAPDRPVVLDMARARAGWERWRDNRARDGQPEGGPRDSTGNTDQSMTALSVDRPVRREATALLTGIFAHSPWLTDSITRDPVFTARIFARGPDAAMADCLAEIRAGAEIESPALFGRRLRRARRKAALVVALADIAGHWPLDRVTGALSDLADTCLGTAVRVLLRQAAGQGWLSDPDGAGLTVLGMGKLGARELNYSSDIDLILLYDPDVARVTKPERLQHHFVRLARDLVRMMESRTADGYVFRTDLRLRPDPGATPLALSVRAAEAYYESMGQNWERAAMIKARPVAGDLAVGAAFLASLRPFLWRRHLDFAAIADIRAIKRQIDARAGGSTVAVEGHNLKLGRGGIREIELFTQTRQLIWGGRDSGLRPPRTVAALHALAAAGRVAPAVADRLAGAYVFLRRLEHRLQMVDDAQTHSLPKDRAGVDRIAAFFGYRDPAAFRATVLDHLRTVESHYAAPFGAEPPLTRSGSLVFTGAGHDAESLETIGRLGFADPETVSATVRGWHHGRYRSTRSARARELLTELVPTLLETFGRTADPDQAFRRLDRLLGQLPAGVQLFSLFQANPSLLALVADIVGTAPRLADGLASRPALLDSVLDPGFFGPLPDRDSMADELRAQLDHAGDMQDVLDLTRRWANDMQFRIGAGWLRKNAASPLAFAPTACTRVAETVIRSLLPLLAAEFATVHGRCAGDGLAVVGLGKLGSGEMAAGSDLDLLLLYDDGPDAGSDPGPDQGLMSVGGRRSLSAAHYYQRLGQRLINALTALTAEGRLYEVDMRLRPSGNAGPLAVSLGGFARYHETGTAALWERMALTRARVIAAGGDFAARIDGVLNAIHRRPPPAGLRDEVIALRERTFRHKAQTHPLRIKHFPGGLVDCEFIVQFLQVQHGWRHPGVIRPHMLAAMAALRAAGCLPDGDAATLAEITGFWQRLQAWLRLTVAGAAEPENIPAALRRKLATALEVADFDALEAEIRRRAAIVTDLRQKLGLRGATG